MLNERAKTLLKSLVERYIEDGQPVGSRALSRVSGLELSAATIRNVMADLEEMGFIASPHASAGRVPTPRGYRFFVDSLLTIQPLAPGMLTQLEEQLHPADPQHLVSAASQMLSELTAFAGVVRTPRRLNDCVRHLEFLRLSEKRILLIMVTADGDVQNRVIITEQEFSPSELTEAANLFNSRFSGSSLDQIRLALQQELVGLNQDIQSLMSHALAAGSTAARTHQDDIVLSGETRLLNDDVPGNLKQLRRLFDMFEKKTLLLQLMDQSQRADGVKIFIGGESGVATLDEFSLVTAPYEVDGQVVGTLGVVGPTRMAYERVIPIVDVTARLLSSALSQH
jgi:heat-inducible transcriptional repressor